MIDTRKQSAVYAPTISSISHSPSLPQLSPEQQLCSHCPEPLQPQPPVIQRAEVTAVNPAVVATVKAKVVEKAVEKAAKECATVGNL